MKDHHSWCEAQLFLAEPMDAAVRSSRQCYLSWDHRAYRYTNLTLKQHIYSMSQNELFVHVLGVFTLKCVRLYSMHNQDTHLGYRSGAITAPWFYYSKLRGLAEQFAWKPSGSVHPSSVSRRLGDRGYFPRGQDHKGRRQRSAGQTMSSYTMSATDTGWAMLNK